jgi:ABC-2 type transport system permease protein
MSTATTTADLAADQPALPPRILSKTRPFYWSVRREIWENRSIYIAPAATALVVLVGLLIGGINLPHRVGQMVSTLNVTKRAMAAALPFTTASVVIMTASFIVAFFYCLGTLQGERRDRTILFWKSLPVSDLTTVLAKAAIPLVVLPLVTFAVVVVTQLIILLASFVILPRVGLPATALLTGSPPLKTWLILLYILGCFALWHAPIWGWLMLVSGWARRASFLWAIGPPLAVAVFERLAFGTAYVDAILRDRFTGALTAAFGSMLDDKGHPAVDLDHFDPMKFLSSPGLWIGLVVAAALFAAVVWQRRYRAPI